MDQNQIITNGNESNLRIIMATKEGAVIDLGEATDVKAYIGDKYRMDEIEDAEVDGNSLLIPISSYLHEGKYDVKVTACVDGRQIVACVHNMIISSHYGAQSHAEYIAVLRESDINYFQGYVAGEGIKVEGDKISADFEKVVDTERLDNATLNVRSGDKYVSQAYIASTQVGGYVDYATGSGSNVSRRVFVKNGQKVTLHKLDDSSHSSIHAIVEPLTSNVRLLAKNFGNTDVVYTAPNDMYVSFVCLAGIQHTYTISGVSIEDAISTKADIEDLSGKADKSELDSKADKSALDSKVDKVSGKSLINSTIANMLYMSGNRIESASDFGYFNGGNVLSFSSLKGNIDDIKGIGVTKIDGNTLRVCNLGRTYIESLTFRVQDSSTAVYDVKFGFHGMWVVDSGIQQSQYSVKNTEYVSGSGEIWSFDVEFIGLSINSVFYYKDGTRIDVLSTKQDNLSYIIGLLHKISNQ